VATIENLINAAYEANLGRPADLSGMTYYLGEIASGNKTVDQVIADIEYAGQQFSQPGQADTLHQTLLTTNHPIQANNNT
jgi:hypothetical protein